MKEWLGAAFAVDNLQLRRLTFEDSPGPVLEHIARGDAVHRVRSLSELKRRLAEGRRVYGLFHPTLPHTPVTFVNVALVPDMAPSLAYIDACADTDTPSCAVFYSITASFGALSGLELPSYLIKAVCDDILHTATSVTTFCTLSPIPGLVRWMTSLPPSALLPHEASRLAELASHFHIDHSPDGESVQAIGFAVLHKIFTNTGPDADSGIEVVARPVLMRLAAQYLLRAKTDAGGCLDPVQRFHVRNGASVRRLNWRGGTSSRMMGESLGMMVNYLYDMQHLTQRHLDYEQMGAVHAHTEVSGLLQ